MDIKSLRYFTETVRLCSFTEAANTLGVTQSTVSKMIRQLEDEVGEPLLLRDARQLALTDTGRVVYERGREILLSVGRLQREVRDTQAVALGSLVLGMPPMINLLFTDALKQFREKYPNITLTLHERTGQDVEQLVSTSELEAGMSVLPIAPQADVVIAKVAEHRVWALGSDQILKVASDTVTLKSLAQLPLVLLNNDFALTRLIRWHFGKIGLNPTVAAQSAQWDWTVAMARAGMGVALLPEPFVSRINVQGLVCKPVSQPDVLWEVALLWNARHVSHALNAWLDICRNTLGGEWPTLTDH